MAEYLISEINNFLLRKQHLSSESKIENILEITKDIQGLHATFARTPRLSIFNIIIIEKSEV